ncbi:MAG TPA: hypothetical protein DDW67_07315, partial [Elusimicrobia bacterium]|nr:hypothetical protein [Elusimicrobiota bacterium]
MRFLGVPRYLLFMAAFLAAVLTAIYLTLPVNRVNMRSRLVMLGDFDGDNRWTAADAATLDRLAADPF